MKTYQMAKTIDTLEIVYQISHENLEAAIVNFLFSMNFLPKNVDVLSVDIGVPVDDNGLVTMTLEVVE